MSSPRLTTVLLPPAKGSSIGGDGVGPPRRKCPRGSAATTKLGKIQRPQMGRIQRPLTRAFRPAGTLEAAYASNRRDAIENIVDADPVAAHVRELMADRAQWTGSASDLLQIGINVGGNAMAPWTRSGWPKSPRALAGRLRRAQTPLRALGIEIVFGREGRLGTRTIRITAMRENRTHDTVSTVRHVSDHGDKAGLNHPPPGLEQAL